MASGESITGLLHQWHEGDSQAAGRLIPLVYDELRRLAQSYLRRERDLAICRTELVHELFLRLPEQPPEFENRSHFFGIAARLMRQILVDLAREQKRLKRSAGHATLELAGNRAGHKLVDVLVLDQCLDRLQDLDPRKARIVELRSFGGLNVEECAEALALSPATIKREWSVALLWLRRELDTATKIGDSLPNDAPGME